MTKMEDDSVKQTTPRLDPNETSSEHVIRAIESLDRRLAQEEAP